MVYLPPELEDRVNSTIELAMAGWSQGLAGIITDDHQRTQRAQGLAREADLIRASLRDELRELLGTVHA